MSYNYNVPADPEHIVGTVEFAHSKTGSDYIALDLNVDGQLVTAVGNMGDVREGERISAYGEYVDHPKYGRQFKVDIFERLVPEDADSIRKYLGSGVIRGIGQSLAGKIVEAFGDKTVKILENDPLQLASIKGITPEFAKEVGEEFHNISSLRKVMNFFSKYSIDQFVISAAWRTYGNDLIRAVNDNPYCLCEPGIDLKFDDAERIAADLNFPPNSEERVYAGIIDALRRGADEFGHCCIPESRLCDAVIRKLVVGENLYCSALDFAISRKSVTKVDVYDRDYIYLTDYYEADSYIAEKLSEMLKEGIKRKSDYTVEIEAVAARHGITYEQCQIDAINACMNSRVFILTGGPGTGKTTALNGVIDLFSSRGMTIKLAAPTGRAAKRIEEVTREPAQTIHRLLEADFTTGTTIFGRDAANPLECDVLIIDEMSMVESLLFASVLKALKKTTRLILVGDSNQIPSIGAGNVLKDLIDSKRVPAVELTEIFRQSAGSRIVTNAHRIINAEMPDLSDGEDFSFIPVYKENDKVKTAVSQYKELMKQFPENGVQVLCLSNIGTVGTKALNKVLQQELNPPAPDKTELNHFDSVFRLGDRVIQIKNDYNAEWKQNGEEFRGIFNGDVGTIIAVDKQKRAVQVDFDGKKVQCQDGMLNNLMHAYALTVHKSQGGEYPAVILVLPYGMERLSRRNIFYTAVTRAKDRLAIIGTEQKIREIMANQNYKRYSCLKLMIEDKFA